MLADSGKVAHSKSSKMSNIHHHTPGHFSIPPPEMLNHLPRDFQNQMLKQPLHHNIEHNGSRPPVAPKPAMTCGVVTDKAVTSSRGNINHTITPDSVCGTPLVSHVKSDSVDSSDGLRSTVKTDATSKTMQANSTREFDHISFNSHKERTNRCAVINKKDLSSLRSNSANHGHILSEEKLTEAPPPPPRFYKLVHDKDSNSILVHANNQLNSSHLCTPTNPTNKSSRDPGSTRSLSKRAAALKSSGSIISAPGSRFGSSSSINNHHDFVPFDYPDFRANLSLMPKNFQDDYFFTHGSQVLIPSAVKNGSTRSAFRSSLDIDDCDFDQKGKKNSTHCRAQENTNAGKLIDRTPSMASIASTNKAFRSNSGVSSRSAIGSAKTALLKQKIMGTRSNSMIDPSASPVFPMKKLQSPHLKKRNDKHSRSAVSSTKDYYQESRHSIQSTPDSLRRVFPSDVNSPKLNDSYHDSRMSLHVKDNDSRQERIIRKSYEHDIPDGKIVMRDQYSPSKVSLLASKYNNAIDEKQSQRKHALINESKSRRSESPNVNRFKPRHPDASLVTDCTAKSPDNSACPNKHNVDPKHLSSPITRSESSLKYTIVPPPSANSMDASGDYKHHYSQTEIINRISTDRLYEEEDASHLLQPLQKLDFVDDQNNIKHAPTNFSLSNNNNCSYDASLDPRSNDMQNNRGLSSRRGMTSGNAQEDVIDSGIGGSSLGSASDKRHGSTGSYYDNRIVNYDKNGRATSPDFQRAVRSDYHHENSPFSDSYRKVTNPGSHSTINSLRSNTSAETYSKRTLVSHSHEGGNSERHQYYNMSDVLPPHDTASLVKDVGGSAASGGVTEERRGLGRKPSLRKTEAVDYADHDMRE